MRVVDGDIQLGVGQRLDFVYGKNKLLQDLSLWLMEPLGTGFTTPNFGSRLDSMSGSADVLGLVDETVD